MSLYIIILQFCCGLLLLVISHSIKYNSNLCYASHALKSDPAYYSYPTDIYFPNAETALKQAECFSVEKSNSKSNHLCLVDEDKSSFCPVEPSHHDIALQNQAEWIKQSVLCNFKSAIENKNDNAEKNVIILGGSVTAGVSTQGCCTKEECTKDEFYCINNYCNWIQYLGRWIETLGKNIKTYNLAHAGYNSDTFKDKIVEKLDTIRQNYQFTKSDIVFLDISVNDANTFEDSTTKMITLERGIEALIRRIHWLSIPNSVPTIILLEMWPGKTIGSSSTNTIHSIYPINTPYTKAYEKVARHYNLSLWSYRDVVLDMHNNKQNPLLSDYLRYKNNFIDSIGHPPWHVHLYYADLISSLIKSQLEQCTTATAAGNLYPVIQSVAELPKPLIEHVFHHCDSKYAPLLSITAPHIQSLRDAYIATTTSSSTSTRSLPLGMSPADLYLEPNIPVYSSSQLNPWVLAEDKVGRPGFLHEFTTTSDRDASTLTFHLNITHTELLARKDNPLLQILYLRTYLNAGKVSVLLCGNPIHDGRYQPVELDALWSDYKTFRFSLPEVFSIDLDIHRYCSNENNKDRSKYVTIQVIHNTYIQHYSPQEKLVRDKEKFKLVEMKVCTIAK